MFVPCRWVSGSSLLLGVLVKLFALPVQAAAIAGGAAEAAAGNVEMAWLQEVPPVSFFGGRPLCTTASLGQKLFTVADIAVAEDKFKEWLLAQEQRLEAFNDNAANSSHQFGGKDHRNQRFRIALPPMGPACRDIQFVGLDSHSTGKYMCGLSILPSSAFPKQTNKKCVIMSAGSGNQWDFEVGVFRRTGYAVHTFDCTCNYCKVPLEIRNRTTFHNFCLGERDSILSLGIVKTSRRVYAPMSVGIKSYTGMLRRIGLRRAPDVLKMDIEGSEFAVMRGIVQELGTSVASADSLLPSQILMELHDTVTAHYISVGNWQGKRTKTSEELSAFMMMLYSLGYRLTHIDWDTESPFAMEVVLFRIFC